MLELLAPAGLPKAVRAAASSGAAHAEYGKLNARRDAKGFSARNLRRRFLIAVCAGVRYENERHSPILSMPEGACHTPRGHARFLPEGRGTGARYET